MVNYFLQGDPYQGMVHFTRFFLNTLLGMGGFIDVAGMANPKLQRVEPHRFGSTLGHYGVGYGPYMQLPFYGNFTLREDGGDMADTLYPVLSWLTANVHRKMDYRRDRNPRAVAGLRWFAAPVFRSLYYGARGILPAS